MKEFKLTSYQIGSCGYYEDNWSFTRIIKNEKNLLEALKEGYLRDAQNRNDYPIVSFPIYREYTRNGKDIESEIKEKHSDTFQKFEAWEKRIKSLIPVLREARKKRENKEREIAQLFALAKKYNYEIKEKNNVF